MTQPLARIHATRVALSISIAAGVLACGQAEHKQQDSGGSVVETLSAEQRARLPGLLAKPIDQYTGEQFYALTRAIRFSGGNDRVRRCRGRAECRGAKATQSTRVRVDAVDQEDSIAPRSIPGNGVIALRARNSGQIPDTMYNMRPTARFEYYLIVLPGANGGNATWRLEELDVAQGIRAHRAVAHGTVTGCNHPFVRGARADFKSCATAAGAPRPAAFGTFQTDAEDPMWFACELGCCTADTDGRS